MRISWAMFLIFISNYATSQLLNIEYRTTPEDNPSSHFLIFLNKVECRLTFPAHGHIMMTQRLDFDFNYKLNGDTIVFSGTNLDTTNLVVQRLLNSHFIKKSDRILYDLVSGYAYVDKKLINNKIITYSIEGEMFRQRTDHKARGRLKRVLNMISKNADSYSISILKGKLGYDKYGIVGMNGVIEIEQKK